MRFTETVLAGAFVIDLERHRDGRGFFARVFSQDEFIEHGLDPVVAQANTSHTRTRGTLRGMHFQYPPGAEAKYVRCTHGSILDVIVDLRPESPTFLRSTAAELTAENGRGLYIPQRFAHGFQTLVDGSEVSYLHSAPYAPQLEGGLSYDDARLGIAWPLPVVGLSPKDAAWPRLDTWVDELTRRMALDVPGA